MKVFITNIHCNSEADSQFDVTYSIGSQRVTFLAELIFVDLNGQRVKTLKLPHELWEAVKFNSVILARIKETLLENPLLTMKELLPLFIGTLSDVYQHPEFL